MTNEQSRKFTKFCLGIIGFIVIFLGVSLCDASKGDSRLGIFVKSDVLEKSLGKFYYKQSKVECWLDNKLVYKGALKKGDMNARIFNEQISPGEHVLKFRWKARVRGDEAARVKLGGRRVVDWVYIPDQEFAEYYFTTQAVQTKVIEITVSRKFGALENIGEVKFKIGVWNKSLDDNKTRREK